MLPLRQMADSRDIRISSGARPVGGTTRRTPDRGDGSGGFHATVFFGSLLTFFGIYALMFCSLVSSFVGASLVFLALCMLIAFYVNLR